MEENKFIIYFNPNINIEVREKDHKNEQLVYKVINAFREEARITNNKKTKFLFIFWI